MGTDAWLERYQDLQRPPATLTLADADEIKMVLAYRLMMPLGQQRLLELLTVRLEEEAKLREEERDGDT